MGINALDNSGVEARILQLIQNPLPLVFPYVMDGTNETSFIPIDMPGTLLDSNR